MNYKIASNKKDIKKKLETYQQRRRNKFRELDNTNLANLKLLCNDNGIKFAALKKDGIIKLLFKHWERKNFQCKDSESDDSKMNMNINNNNNNNKKNEKKTNKKKGKKNKITNLNIDKNEEPPLKKQKIQDGKQYRIMHSNLPNIDLNIENNPKK